MHSFFTRAAVISSSRSPLFQYVKNVRRPFTICAFQSCASTDLCNNTSANPKLSIQTIKQNTKMLSLDRKAMEEARLARVAAKRAAESQAPEPRPSKMIKFAEFENEGKISAVDGADAQFAPPCGLEHSKEDLTAVQKEAKNAHSSPHLDYPNGAIKKTWAFGYERKNDIKIEEVLQRRDLNTAVISSFCFDFDWLVSKFDLAATKFIFVLQARNQSEVRYYIRRDEVLIVTAATEAST